MTGTSHARTVVPLPSPGLRRSASPTDSCGFAPGDLAAPYRVPPVRWSGERCSSGAAHAGPFADAP